MMASLLSFLLPCLQAYSTTRALQVALRKEGFECPVGNSDHKNYFFV